MKTNLQQFPETNELVLLVWGSSNNTFLSTKLPGSDRTPHNHIGIQNYNILNVCLHMVQPVQHCCWLVDGWIPAM
jgi:hypothetical protein